jgi:hypothetical protein
MHLPKLTLDGNCFSRFSRTLSMRIALYLWKMTEDEAQIILLKRNTKLSLNNFD